MVSFNTMYAGLRKDKILAEAISEEEDQGDFSL
jgi:hypothetical protein